MRTQKKHKGFTLVELLAVVGIIAVLVAVAIPVFTASTEKAEDAACLANRRSLKGLIVTAYLSGGNMNTAFNDNKANFRCPTGGTLSYTFNKTDGLVEVSCSVHSQSNFLNALYQAYVDSKTTVKTITSYAMKDVNSTAYKLYSSLDPQQQALLDNYTWTITKTDHTSDSNPDGMRIFIADKNIVENSTELAYVYKLDPVTGMYQASLSPDARNFRTNSDGVRYITGYSGEWGSYENGKFVKDGWMDALPADLANPSAG